ncbi:MAG: hypothetical protein ACC726_03050 [Chloroflexota bacterium]
MKLKKIGMMFAAVLFAFAVVACADNNNDATEAPSAAPAATEAA